MKAVSCRTHDLVLSNLVAEHVAGFEIDGEGRWLREGNYVEFSNRIPFATSADAVLPLLDNSGLIVARFHRQITKNLWKIRIVQADTGYYIEQEGDSLPRITCLALLASRGFSIIP